MPSMKLKNTSFIQISGRSVRLQTSDRAGSKLGRLAGLAIDAGFDWVEYTNSEYITASVIPDGKCITVNC